MECKSRPHVTHPLEQLIRWFVLDKQFNAED